MSPVLSSEKGLNVFEDDQLGQYFQGKDTSANKVNIVKNRTIKIKCDILIPVFKGNSTKFICQKLGEMIDKLLYIKNFNQRPINLIVF